PSFRRLHQARAVESADLEGRGPGVEADHCVPDGMAAVDQHSYIYGRPATAAGVRGPYLGRLLDRRVPGRQAESAHDAPEGRLLPAQRRTAERPGDAVGIPDPTPIPQRGLSDVGHHRL